MTDEPRISGSIEFDSPEEAKAAFDRLANKLMTRESQPTPPATVAATRRLLLHESKHCYVDDLVAAFETAVRADERERAALLFVRASLRFDELAEFMDKHGWTPALAVWGAKECYAWSAGRYEYRATDTRWTRKKRVPAKPPEGARMPDVREL